MDLVTAAAATDSLVLLLLLLSHLDPRRPLLPHPGLLKDLHHQQRYGEHNQIGFYADCNLVCRGETKTGVRQCCTEGLGQHSPRDFTPTN